MRLRAWPKPSACIWRVRPSGPLHLHHHLLLLRLRTHRYIFLWITIPTGDPVQQAYAIAGSQPVGNAPLSRGNAPYGESVAHGFMGNGAGTQNVGTQSAKPARWQTKRHRKTDGNRPKAWNRCSPTRRDPRCWPWRDCLCWAYAWRWRRKALKHADCAGTARRGRHRRVLASFQREGRPVVTMLAGITIIFAAYALYIATHVRTMRPHGMPRSPCWSPAWRCLSACCWRSCHGSWR